MIAARNLRLFLAYRGTTRALLFAPYILHYMTAVRGLSLGAYGLLQLLYYWVVMGAEIPSGVLADRWGRRRTLIAGAAANALGCFVFAVADRFLVFAAGEVLFALGTALASGADSALLFDSLAADGRQEEYPRAEGRAQATWLIVTAIGLPLADRLLVRGDDPVLAYWITGALSLAGVGCALAMREPPVGTRLSTREITLGALRDVVSVRSITRMVAYSVGLFVLLRAAIVSFFNPCLAGMGVPVNFYGTVLAAINVAGAVTALRAHRWLARRGERAALVAMPAAMLVMFALLIPARVPAAAALFLVQGAVFGAYPLVVRSILNRHVPSAARRASILSIESMACRLAFGLVAVLAGWGIEAIGLPAALALTAGVACLPFALLPLLARGRRV